MAGTLDFAGMVPGFDFLQNLIKGAGANLPAMGQWVAPTLDPEELDKRIKELRTVQFWLEQNARLLATTIQALEVQRMTLATLKTMNMPMSDLRDALAIKTPVPAAPAQPAAPSAPAAEAAAAPAAADKSAPPAVDPVQWWGALTQQFSQIAAQALQPGAVEAGNAATVAAPAKAKPSKPAGKAAGTTAKRSR